MVSGHIQYCCGETVVCTSAISTPRYIKIPVNRPVLRYRTFITDHLAKQLGLKQEHKQLLSTSVKIIFEKILKIEIEIAKKSKETRG